ncbi:MAG TPA: NADH-quinone oxidoreductase subunit N [Candidatus Baltobacteraceae bacterium]|jgi:NADH-quinone oxidoreductase subunit N|nr:NADH-quinone oxidoreductase subunit N [Candidatus Baltobacteraceae bacterium]
MNLSLLTLEIAVLALALAILLIDLWTPHEFQHRLGYVALAGLLIIFAASFLGAGGGPAATGFHGMYVQDGLALFFKRLFLVSAIFVVLMGVEFSGRIAMGIGEFYTVILLALAGMMFAASANDLVMVFVALELISISFYILVSFHRSRMHSLEAGVKYLILSALAAAVLVFGIALIFGAANSTGFADLSAQGERLTGDKVFWLGMLLVLLGLAFKISAFPLQMWAPDVYQGAPTPVTAFLAMGSKAAGFVLLLRVLFVAAPALAAQWDKLLILAAAITILYGNLCAIPQRNLKRLLGYSSIANAGYMLLGVAALNADGSAAVLYYLTGYLFTLAVAFAVICIVARESEDIASLAGLGQRSPFLALSMTLAMVSLAGLPPMAGFLGKFLLLRAVIQRAALNPAYFCLAAVTIIGVVISIYFYFGVIRAVYWSKEPADLSPIVVSLPMKISLGVCVLAMLYLGIYPGPVLASATEAVKALRF